MPDEVSGGLFRLTHPDMPGEIVLTRSGFRYPTSTGTGGMRVEFDLPLSPAVAGPKALAAGPPPGALFDPGAFSVTLE
jgi:hypothetical protein